MKAIHYEASDTDQLVPLCRSKSSDPLLTKRVDLVTCSKCLDQLPHIRIP
jgi:hypothetical protein